MAVSAFTPATALSNRHIQTLLPVILGKHSQQTMRRQSVSLPDGDFVDLDWNRLPDQQNPAPLLIIFHGLEGSSASHYCQSLMKAATRAGWYAVVMNFRGCSGRLNLKPRLYHSGETADADFVIRRLRQQLPQVPIYAAGFSLGGNMLLKLAGEQGADLPLDAIVAISAPVKLDQSTRYMMEGLSRFYQHYLLKALKRKMLRKYGQHNYQHDYGLDRQAILDCRTLRDFDDAVTARLHGFQDAMDYYQRSSAHDFVAKVAQPCLIVHAQDDPIAPASSLPEQSALPPHVKVELTTHGGHVGYISGSFFSPSYWLAGRVMAYLHELR